MGVLPLPCEIRCGRQLGAIWCNTSCVTRPVELHTLDCTCGNIFVPHRSLCLNKKISQYAPPLFFFPFRHLFASSGANLWGWERWISTTYQTADHRFQHTCCLKEIWNVKGRTSLRFPSVERPECPPVWADGQTADTRHASDVSKCRPSAVASRSIWTQLEVQI